MYYPVNEAEAAEMRENMQDKKLIKKISDEVYELCRIHHLNKLIKLSVTVNHQSKIDEKTLLRKLKHIDKKRFGSWSRIIVNHDDINQQAAILTELEGEKTEEGAEGFTR